MASPRPRGIRPEAHGHRHAAQLSGPPRVQLAMWRCFTVSLAPAHAPSSTPSANWPWVNHLFADGAYKRLKLMDKTAYLDFVVEVIRRSDTQKAFEVLPRRWAVERSFGWVTCWRRLMRDHEALRDVSEAMILVAMGGNLLRRSTHP